MNRQQQAFGANFRSAGRYSTGQLSVDRSITVDELMLFLIWDTITPAELNVRLAAAEEAGMQNIFFANFYQSWNRSGKTGWSGWIGRFLPVFTGLKKFLDSPVLPLRI
jgi:hypothetical protein